MRKLIACLTLCTMPAFALNPYLVDSTLSNGPCDRPARIYGCSFDRRDRVGAKVPRHPGTGPDSREYAAAFGQAAPCWLALRS